LTWARNPGGRRQQSGNEGSLRQLDELFPLMLHPALEKDEGRWPELEAGQHRVLAMEVWALGRSADAQKVKDQYRMANQDQRRDVLEVRSPSNSTVVELTRTQFFGFACRVLDYDELQAKPEIKRFVRRNATDVYRPNSQGDTFAILRESWRLVPSTEREIIIDRKKDPTGKYPQGFTTWLHRATGTILKDGHDADRLKRVLVSDEYSALADEFIRLPWGKAVFTYSLWGHLMALDMYSVSRTLFAHATAVEFNVFQWTQNWVTVFLNMHTHVFGSKAYQVFDTDLILINKAWLAGDARYDRKLLRQIFYPHPKDGGSKDIPAIIAEQWGPTSSVMQ
jgi:hypothetical protein